MRAILVPLLFFTLAALVLVAPYTGVLLWAWITMMNPHQIAGGWLATFPLNTLVVVLLAAALLLHSELVLPPLNGLAVLTVLFMGWCLITTAFALSPVVSAARADLSIKNMILALIVAATTGNRTRCQAFVWVVVLSYGYFGVKGGLFTIVTGGAGNVMGPAGTTLEDRNALALILLMTMPLANFLYRTSASRGTRWALVCLMLLNAVAVMGTYSRGGMIGLVVLGLYLWAVSSHKLVGAAAVIALGLVGWTVLPERWVDRMSTVQSAEEDESFQGREDAWRFAYNAAASRFMGVGFSGTEDPVVFSQYMPDPVATAGRGRAAHSIYFQVLGDHGFVGLGLFLAIVAMAWRTAGRLARLSGPDAAWLAELGRMARVALATYLVAGAALSMAYDASIMCLFGLLSAAERLSRGYRTTQVDRLTPGAASGAKRRAALAGPGGPAAASVARDARSWPGGGWPRTDMQTARMPRGRCHGYRRPAGAEDRD